MTGNFFETVDYKKLPEYDGHEVYFCRGPGGNIIGVVFVHDRTLGIPLGGIRVCSYDSPEAVFTDGFRLSKGMSYKAAYANLPFGGCKGVIVVPKTPEVLETFAHFAENLDCYLAGDVGTHATDLAHMAHWSDRFHGYSTNLTVNGRRGSGDSARMTAIGVFYGMRACVDFLYDYRRSFDSLHIKVQGVGKVGKELVHILDYLGAKITISDANETTAYSVAQKYKRVRVVPREDIYDIPADVFAPCALGGVLNAGTIPRLRKSCDIICGSANNQFERYEDARWLYEEGIVVATDFVVNAGGMVNITEERHVKGYDADRAILVTKKIENRQMELLCEAQRQGRAGDYIAIDRVQEHLRSRKTFTAGHRPLTPEERANWHTSRFSHLR